MKFIHSADWQLGARFSQFGPKAESLRQVRFQTLETALRKADEASVDFFLIAGDLFEDGQVDDTVIHTTFEKFRRFPGVPVFILPGNHDPNDGPSSIWNRKPFLTKPSNVTVLAEPGVTECGGAQLLASPLRQKKSTIDPTLKIAELARQPADGRIRIGVTHGALAFPGKHESNDHPIVPDAETRTGVDYLAVGHWHTWQVYDHGRHVMPGTDGRLVMPGTPEPDAFEQDGAGHVALVEISSPQSKPVVQKVPVATLQWMTLDLDCADAPAGRQGLEHRLAEVKPAADRTVVRVRLHGRVSPRVLAETRQWLESALQPYLAQQVLDETAVALTVAEIDEIKNRSPLLAQALTDLAQIEHLATNSPVPAGMDLSQAISSLDEARALVSRVIGEKPEKTDLTRLDAEFFKLAHQLLSQELQEATQ